MACNSAPRAAVSDSAPVVSQNTAPQAPALDETNLRQQKIARFVDVNAESFANYAMKFAKTNGIDQAIQKELDTQNLLQPADLRKAYESHQYSPLFVIDGTLPDMLQALTAEFERLDQHGLSAIDATAWMNARTDLANALDGTAPEAFAFTDDEKKVIAKAIFDRNVDITDTISVKKLIAFLVQDKDALPRLHQTVAERTHRLAHALSQTARLDVLTADLAMRFARAMAFENMTHLTSAESKIAGKEPGQAQYDKISAMRTQRWFASLVEAVDAPVQKPKMPETAGETAHDATSESPVAAIAPEAAVDPEADSAETERAAAEAHAQMLQRAQTVADLVQALYPAHPGYYRQLMEAHVRYAEMPDWDKITPATLTLDKPAKTVPALRRRLAIEGLYHGDPDNPSNVYDGELRDAVRLYHETHQLTFEKNRPLQKDFWESLNVPRTKRLAQIDENLRRWHKTQIIESPYYIFVNVPDFHGEIWRDGERVYRFPVVAGNANRWCNPETNTWMYINATPLMHSRMLYLEYNPYWLVPPRIEREEYLAKINADPNWLTDHGFEYYTDKDRTILRQLPGENNALGRVKFIFPNPHSTFLHDSPQKRFFKYPVRAFSHGCMRVWEPLELAKRLLQYDGQWRDSIPTEIESFETMHFDFKTRFDVFIDYFTVRVDDEGAVHFLADPYRYVKYAIEPPSPKTLACTPRPRTVIPRPNERGEDVGADDDAG